MSCCGGRVVEVAEDEERSVGSRLAHARAGAPRSRRSPSRAAAGRSAARAARRSSSEPAKRSSTSTETARAPPRLVRRHDVLDARVRADVAHRRRAPLELGDRAEAPAARVRPRSLMCARTPRARRAAPPRRPESIASRACSRPSRMSSASLTAAIPPAALRSTAERWPPSAPASTSRSAAAFVAGRRRAARPGRSARLPRSSGSSSYSRIAPAWTSQTRFGPHGESSSMPPAPCTTYARVTSSWTSAVGQRPHELRRVDAEDEGARAGRVRERAEHVEDRTRRELPPDRRRVAHRRDGAPARRGSRSRARRSSARSAPGGSSSRKPSASSTSAEPVCDEAERLPCFATAAPAAAVTRAAAVEMLYVFAPSPPVPTTSTRSVRDGFTRRTCSRIASAQPAISSAVSPFTRSATRKPAICACVASPAMISRHRRAGLVAREVVAVEQPRERVLDHSFPSRKLRASAGPSGVSTDSGWNWTPTAGSSRCRTAITSPSSANAVGSSTSGSRVAASEW